MHGLYSTILLMITLYILLAYISTTSWALSSGNDIPTIPFIVEHDHLILLQPTRYMYNQHYPHSHYHENRGTLEHSYLHLVVCHRLYVILTLHCQPEGSHKINTLLGLAMKKLSSSV